MPGLIRETPVLAWSARELHTLRLDPLTLRAGLTPDDYGTFTLTIREDPLWPRSGASAAALATADPVADGWTVAATGTATAEADDETVDIQVTVPTAAGKNRYAVDVVADGGAAGRVQILECTFLTVLPSLKS